MFSNEVHPRHGIDKRKLYNWVINDKPGELMWLRKTDLNVDDSYQREPHNNRVLRITGQWSWLSCGAIIVAKRLEGKGFYVVDGQHRVMAALKRSDIDLLPCVVFETIDNKQEAIAFYNSNTNRRLPTSYEKWKAQLVSGDPGVHFVNDLVVNSGRVVSNSSGPTSVRCLSTLLRAAEKNRDLMRSIWFLAVDICRGDTLNDRIFDGLFWLESNLPEGQTLTKGKWRDRVMSVGGKGLLLAANRAAVLYAKGGEKVWGLGMLEALNKGCRIHIVLRDK